MAKRQKTALYSLKVGQFHGYFDGVRYDVRPGKRCEVSPGVYELPKKAGDIWVKGGFLASVKAQLSEDDG